MPQFTIKLKTQNANVKLEADTVHVVGAGGPNAALVLNRGGNTSDRVVFVAPMENVNYLEVDGDS